MPNKKGGARTGSGRKPVDDPKIQLTLYIRRSDIEALGGIAEARIRAIKFLETAAVVDSNPDFPYNLKAGNVQGS